MALMCQTYYQAQEWFRFEPRHAPRFDYSKSKIPPKACLRMEQDEDGNEVMRLSAVTDWNDDRSLFRFVDPQQDDVSYARFEPKFAQGQVLCVFTSKDGEQRIGLTKHMCPGQYNGLDEQNLDKWEQRETSLFRMGGWKWCPDDWRRLLLKDSDGNPSHIDAFGRQYFRLSTKNAKKMALRCQIPSVICPLDQREENKVPLEEAHPKQEGWKGRSKGPEDQPKSADAADRTSDDVVLSRDRDGEENLFHTVFWDK